MSTTRILAALILSIVCAAPASASLAVSPPRTSGFGLAVVRLGCFLARHFVPVVVYRSPLDRQCRGPCTRRTGLATARPNSTGQRMATRG